MGKVLKFADKVKKVKRHDCVCFTTDDGDVIEFKVESRSSEQLEALTAKYDAMKPTAPTKRLPAANGKFKVIANEDDPVYKTEVGRINKLHFAHMALLFLAEDERPDAETDEAQVQEILNVELAGFVSKIVNKGLEISGLTDNNTEEALEEAKND